MNYTSEDSIFLEKKVMYQWYVAKMVLCAFFTGVREKSRPLTRAVKILTGCHWNSKIFCLIYVWAVIIDLILQPYDISCNTSYLREMPQFAIHFEQRMVLFDTPKDPYRGVFCRNTYSKGMSKFYTVRSKL